MTTHLFNVHAMKTSIQCLHILLSNGGRVNRTEVPDTLPHYPVDFFSSSPIQNILWGTSQAPYKEDTRGFFGEVEE